MTTKPPGTAALRHAWPLQSGFIEQPLNRRFFAGFWSFNEASFSAFGRVMNHGPEQSAPRIVKHNQC
jgi:hypothetical protein